MTRRQFLAGLAAGGAGLAALLASRQGVAGDANVVGDAKESAIEPIDVPHEAWRPLLSEQQYRVLFEEHTERAFTSPLNEEKRSGKYLCAACFLPLFEASAKYDSGTGWPSFWQALPGRIGTRRDFKLLLPRTEYHCVRCGGHQGHVFKDGPPPTGLRYCNNGVALRFVPEAEPPPPLRKPS